MLELLRYWRENPPTHELLAGFVGYKAPSEEDMAIAEAAADAIAQPHSKADFEKLLASHGIPVH